MSGLARGLLSLKVSDQLEDLMTVLSYDVLRVLLHRSGIQSLSEPTADVLTVLVQDMHLNGIVTYERAGSARHNRRSAFL